jgi:Mrp family chromosome partitioning ATPase
MPAYSGATTLILRSQNLAATPAGVDDGRIRVVSVWASPPDVRVLAMLGETSDDVVAELRVIRHRLERLRAEGTTTIGVTSAKPGEGKSTFAVQLALVLSEAQRSRVLLVEASLHTPALARLLGFQVPPGLGFSAQLARRMRRSVPAPAGGPWPAPDGAIEPWAVLALGPALHTLVESEDERGYPEALHSTHFAQALEHLGHRYDWVVVDSPTVLGSGDANVVEEAVDGMIVVARSRSSRGGDVRAAVRQLGDRKAMGVVLWDARRSAR